MAFNDHPYKKLYLTHEGTTREYSMVRVGDKVVWRKPISYTVKAYIVDNSGAIKSYDAIADGAFTPSLPLTIYYKNGLEAYPSNKPWSVSKGPSYNDDLNNPDIIKYSDWVYYDYSLAQGYVVRQINSKIIQDGVEVTMLELYDYQALNNFSIDIRIKPKLYSFSILDVNGGLSLTRQLYRTPGRIANIQGVTEASYIAENASIYYLDTITAYLSCKTGWQFPEGQSSSPSTLIDRNVNLSVYTEPIPYTVTINKSTGVESVVIKRVHRLLPTENYDEVIVTSGSTVNYGDDITVSATASTGYVVLSYTSSYTDIQNNISAVIGARLMEGTLNLVYNTGIREIQVFQIDDRGVATSDTSMSEGDTLYYGNRYLIKIYSDTGYILDINNATNYNHIITFTPSEDGSTFTVDYTASVKEYTLNIVNNIPGGSFWVRRTASPLGQGSIGVIYNGSTVYYNDELLIHIDCTHTSYIIDPGYTNEEDRTVVCTTFDSSDRFTYTITGSLGTELHLLQSGFSGYVIDSQNRPIKLNMPADPSTAITYYDGIKLRDSDGAIFYFKNNETFLYPWSQVYDICWRYYGEYNTTLTPLSKLYSSSEQSYYYVLYPKINNREVQYYVRFYTDNVSDGYLSTISYNLVPDAHWNFAPVPTSEVKVSLVSSKYNNTNAYTRTVAINCSTASGLNCKYGDTIKIEWTGGATGYTKVSGIDVYDSRGVTRIKTIYSGDSLYVDQPFILKFKINIEYYYLTFNLQYVDFSSYYEDIYSTHYLVNQIIYSEETYNRTVPYGAKFVKHSEIIDYQDPMDLITDTHYNDTEYIITQNTVITSKYSNKFVAPTLDVRLSKYKKEGGDWWTKWGIYLTLNINNPNTSEGQPYIFDILIRRYESNRLISEYQTLRYNNTTGSNSITFKDTDNISVLRQDTLTSSNLFIADYNVSPGDYTLKYEVTVCVQGKTVMSVSRSTSDLVTDDVSEYIGLY